MRKAGIDAGAAYTKIAAFDSNNQLIQRCIRSIVVAGKPEVALNGDRAPSYWVDGKQWSIIEQSQKARTTQFDEYPYSSINTVLTHHGLLSAGINNDEIEVSSCIPLSHYYDENQDQALEFKQKKKRAIEREIKMATGGGLPLLKHSVTAPEGLAGWIDITYNFNGDRIEGSPDGYVGLVDIGGRTTDICVVRGLIVTPSTIKTLRHGYLDLFAQLNELIGIKYNTRQFSVAALDDAMRSKRIEIESGRVVDIPELVEQAMNNFTEELLMNINNVFDSDMQLSGVCYFGGGVEPIREALSRQRNAFIPRDPQFANARGALKAFKITG